MRWFRTLPKAPVAWSTLLSLTDGGDEAAAELRQRQLAMFTGLVPLSTIAVLALATALAMSAGSGRNEIVAWLWLAIVTVLTLGFAAIVWGLRPNAAAEGVDAGTIRLVAALSGVVAVAYNSYSVLLLVRGGAPQEYYASGSTQLAMMIAGLYLFSAIPLAAIVFLGAGLIFYSATVAFLIGAGLVPWVAAVVPAGLAVIVFAAILHGAAAQAVNERTLIEMRSRGDVIAMLLHEIEQNGRDWLWEVDAEMRLQHLSARFAQEFGWTEAQLSGRAFLGAILKPGGDIERVREAVEERRSFRNLLVSVELRGDRRWWSLSGSPRRDSSGRFIGFIGVGADVTDLRRSQEQIERMANQDGLTGLANRTVLRKAVAAALAEAHPQRQPVALLLIDLDRFKAVNDTLGHLAGDRLLRDVAARLASAAPASALTARLGGDEFAMLLPGSSRAAAESAGRLIVERLAEAFELNGKSVAIGGSVGLAVGPEDGAQLDELFRAADLALYSAKENGRGIVRVYDRSLSDAAEERRELEAALKGALASNQLSLAFQPIYRLGTGEVRGFEALLRWAHPKRGPIPPNKFIPIAEEAGLLDPIGEWVIRTACAWAARWPDSIGVSVNLSPSQLVNPRLPAVVLNALATSGLAPQRLELEITESVLMSESDENRAALAQLAAIGVRLGLDDFGTGYSTLGYLRSSVFSTIKIDRSFVRESVDGGGQSAQIVRTIVELAERLGMETVAEGAETSQELEAVRALGCRSVQGYFTGRPMPPEAATELALTPHAPADAQPASPRILRAA
jgi:diguanylate cyclase (GGDEF)-like protein/PAS domain S-box-containing protein